MPCAAPGQAAIALQLRHAHAHLGGHRSAVGGDRRQRAGGADLRCTSCTARRPGRGCRGRAAPASSENRQGKRMPAAGRPRRSGSSRCRRCSKPPGFSAPGGRDAARRRARASAPAPPRPPSPRAPSRARRFTASLLRRAESGGSPMPSDSALVGQERRTRRTARSPGRACRSSAAGPGCRPRRRRCSRCTPRSCGAPRRARRPRRRRRSRRPGRGSGRSRRARRRCRSGRRPAPPARRRRGLRRRRALNTSRPMIDGGIDERQHLHAERRPTRPPRRPTPRSAVRRGSLQVGQPPAEAREQPAGRVARRQHRQVRADPPAEEAAEREHQDQPRQQRPEQDPRRAVREGDRGDGERVDQLHAEDANGACASDDRRGGDHRSAGDHVERSVARNARTLRLERGEMPQRQQ